MDKTLLMNNLDLYSAINKFEKEWKEDIKKEVNEYPCTLISSYTEDGEFGEMYMFTTVVKREFINSK